MKSSFYKIFSIILVGALIILLSLQFVPRKPTVSEEDISFKKASAFIEKGDIMQGVLMLKKILEENPNNIDVIWKLGNLSMQSTQYEIAVDRFKKFVSLTDGEDKVSGLISLSDAYFLFGKKQKALDNLKIAEAMNKNAKIKDEIKQRINIIINQN